MTTDANMAGNDRDTGTSIVSSLIEAGLNASPFTPLALGCTDVHLLGQLSIIPSPLGTEAARKISQSFQTPKLEVCHVLHVDIRPINAEITKDFEASLGWGIDRGGSWGGRVSQMKQDRRAFT